MHDYGYAHNVYEVTTIKYLAGRVSEVSLGSRLDTAHIRILLKAEVRLVVNRGWSIPFTAVGEIRNQQPLMTAISNYPKLTRPLTNY